VNTLDGRKAGTARSGPRFRYRLRHDTGGAGIGGRALHRLTAPSSNAARSYEGRMNPMRLLVMLVNQRLPSGPIAIPWGARTSALLVS
jgi:hypothetical protein